ncbi:nuclear transport factor 2 family protein [Bowmanella denitrificans]|uniref:nuclear transport factor 2 family protein n=1 Tax=Bowmanella denitrificans TaxID=366582 RepID=UPI001C0F159B|nr:nuclear transport factor 2 family protein [Bowmanella denitrificans]
MKHRLFTLVTLLISLTFTQLAAADAGTGATDAKEHAAIETAIQHYFHGSAYSDKARLKQAFHKQARLYLEKNDQPYWEVTANDYIGWYKDANQGQFNGRLGRILNVDREGNLAIVKAEILMPAKQQRYIDMLLLKKLDGVWQILSKSAVGEASSHNGQRILFILSSAHFHGDSNLPTGVSFSEIVNAYDEFARAGFSVDFVSPQGGALPLAYINTSEPMHKKYLYDSDFMYAIGHTLTPEQVVAEDYRAVHYVGGTNAMYGVADHPQLQKISMSIYEQHGGIISAVCHGTAGIAHLRLQNGEYLVKGRRISGYPDEYEHPDRPYFKEFPFLITKTIEQRGGTFLYSPRNTPHIEIDGRIITGQNYLSSAGVARAMIDMLTKETVE